MKAFNVGDLVTVWVDDLDPNHRKRWKDKYGLIEELIYTEQSRYSGVTFIRVFFPELNEAKEFVPDRVRKANSEKQTAAVISRKEYERFLENEEDFLNSLGSD